MNKVLLVIQREYLARVKKKSFLIATLLTPLIFPAIMAVFVWIAVEEKENQSLRVIEVVDETGLFFMESSEQYAFSSSGKSLEEAKALVTKEERYGVLYLPKMELSAPQGIQFYGLENPSTSLIGYLEGALKRKIEDQRLYAKGIDPIVLKEIRTDVKIQSLTRMMLIAGFTPQNPAALFEFFFDLKIARGPKTFQISGELYGFVARGKG